MRKRLLLSASILAGLACVVLLVLAMLPPRPGVTKVNFDRIENGMGYDEVDAVLGKPSLTVICDNVPFAMWREDDGATARVSFDDGKVTDKRWTASTETALTKIRRWLRL